MSNEVKCNNCSEDIFPSYTEPSEFKLRRSQRILKKNSQTIENVNRENFFNYVEELMLPHQTNDYSTAVSKIIVDDEDDGRSTPDFTFLLNSAVASWNEIPQKFEFLQQHQTKCALDMQDELKTKTTTKVELKESSRTAKRRGRPKRKASKECSQKPLYSTLFDDESIILPKRKKSHSCEILQTDHSTVEMIVDKSATEELEYGRKTKAKRTRKRNISMECNNKLPTALDCERKIPSLENSMKFNECIEDGNILRRAQSFNNNNNGIKKPVTKQLKKAASVIVLSSDSCKIIVDKSTADERQHGRKSQANSIRNSNRSMQFDQNDSERILSSGSCKIAQSQLPTEMDIDNHAADKGTSKCNSIKMERIQVSDSKRKKSNVQNSRRQQNIKSEPKTVSKRKTMAGLPSSSERKRMQVETTESIILSQNYVAPQVKRYNNSCQNNFPYELVANKPSLLPAVYPPHFTQQRAIAAPQDQYSYCMPTPENSQIIVPQAIEIESKRSSSTYSIGSVGEFFEKDELDEILNTEKIIYHLTEVHVRSLAISLNLNAEKLFSLIDNIVELNSNVLRDDFALIEPAVDIKYEII